MKENERWAGHILYFTIVSALAAGLIAGCAALWADPSKIPGPVAKWLIVVSVVLGSVTLGVAVFGSVQLSNYLVNGEDLRPALRLRLGRRVTKFAGTTFIALVFDLLAIAGTFISAAVEPAPEPPSAAPDISKLVQQLVAVAQTSASAADAARRAAEKAAQVATGLGSERAKRLDELQDQVNELRRRPPQLTERVLVTSDWMRIQTALRAGADGRKGPQTCLKIRAWQREHGYDDTGVLTPEQVDALIGVESQVVRRLDLQPCPSAPRIVGPKHHH